MPMFTSSLSEGGALFVTNQEAQHSKLVQESRAAGLQEVVNSKLCQHVCACAVQDGEVPRWRSPAMSLHAAYVDDVLLEEFCKCSQEVCLHSSLKSSFRRHKSRWRMVESGVVF